MQENRTWHVNPKSLGQSLAVTKFEKCNSVFFYGWQIWQTLLWSYEFITCQLWLLLLKHVNDSLVIQLYKLIIKEFYNIWYLLDIWLQYVNIEAFHNMENSLSFITGSLIPIYQAGYLVKLFTSSAYYPNFHEQYSLSFQRNFFSVNVARSIHQFHTAAMLAF